jgi:uncharacterized protein (TIGR02611 family)
MIERTKHSWHEFKDSDPGRRFQDRYDRRQQDTKGRWNIGTVLNVVLGIGIAVAGLLLVPAPGPGWIITFVGLALLGSEFAPLARALDWGEVKLRSAAGWARDVWQHSSLVVKVLAVLVGVLCMAALGYGAYRLLVSG